MAKSRTMSASMKQVTSTVVVVALLGFLVAMVQAEVEGQVGNATSTSWDSFVEKGAGVVSNSTSPSTTTTPGESFAAGNVAESTSFASVPTGPASAPEGSVSVSASNEVGDVGTGGKLVSDADSTYTDFGNSSFASDQYYAGGDDQGTDENLFGDFSAISNPAPTTDSDARFNDVTFDMSETPDVETTSDSTQTSFTSYSSGSQCSTGNPTDDCWRCDPNWASNPQKYASCAFGFGRNAIGGKNGKIYVVTSPRDDNPANPAYGTLRWGVTRLEPLWIIFKTSMTIRLKNELMITSYKTIDGRGVTVHITGGAGLTLQYVSHVIITNIAIHDISPTGPATIMTSTNHVGSRGRTDGDCISMFTTTDVWIDHCYLARAADGLVDAIRGSTRITISNNFLTQHDKCILLGAHKNDYEDRNMQVTVALNVFGPGLIQRMPRCRFGFCHVVNNHYPNGWGIYAVGGSEAPTFLIEGNLFNPGKGAKEIAKRIDDGGSAFGGPNKWNWKSRGDQFQNGAFFKASGAQYDMQAYAKASSCAARPSYMVPQMTAGAGPLKCFRGRHC